jgi:hypothetical protein
LSLLLPLSCFAYTIIKNAAFDMWRKLPLQSSRKRDTNRGLSSSAVALVLQAALLLAVTVMALW